MPRGDQPASRANLKAKNAGVASGAVRRERSAEVRAAMEASGAAVLEDPLVQLDSTMSQLAKYVARMLTKLNTGKFGDLTSAQNGTIKELRLTIQDCQNYRDRLTSDAPAQIIAIEIVKRLREANLSQLSPPPPEDPPADDDPD